MSFRIIRGNNIALAKELVVTIYQYFPSVTPIYQTFWSLLSVSSFELFLTQNPL